MRYFSVKVNSDHCMYVYIREMVSRAPCMLIRPDDTESSPSSKKTAKNQDSISDSLSTGSLDYSGCIDSSILQYCLL